MIWAQILSDFAVAPEVKRKKEPATHKRCVGCEKALPLDMFYPRQGHGYMSRCKPCYGEQQKQRRKK